jgi:hypothetical protein
MFHSQDASSSLLLSCAILVTFYLQLVVPATSKPSFSKKVEHESHRQRWVVNSNLDSAEEVTGEDSHVILGHI